MEIILLSLISLIALFVAVNFILIIFALCANPKQVTDKYFKDIHDELSNH